MSDMRLMIIVRFFKGNFLIFVSQTGHFLSLLRSSVKQLGHNFNIFTSNIISWIEWWGTAKMVNKSLHHLVNNV